MEKRRESMLLASSKVGGVNDRLFDDKEDGEESLAKGEEEGASGEPIVADNNVVMVSSPIDRKSF